MTVNELIELLNNIDDKDKEIYVNVHGWEYYLDKNYDDSEYLCLFDQKPMCGWPTWESEL